MHHPSISISISISLYISISISISHPYPYPYPYPCPYTYPYPYPIPSIHPSIHPPIHPSCFLTSIFINVGYVHGKVDPIVAFYHLHNCVKYMRVLAFKLILEQVNSNESMLKENPCSMGRFRPFLHWYNVKNMPLHKVAWWPANVDYSAADFNRILIQISRFFNLMNLMMFSKCQPLCSGLSALVIVNSSPHFLIPITMNSLHTQMYGHMAVEGRPLPDNMLPGDITVTT